jgi:hypothetical protein
MSAVVDDELGPLPGCKSAQIGKALLGHNNLNVVLRMIHVRGLWCTIPMWAAFRP